jgi:hypothetical protein
MLSIGQPAHGRDRPEFTVRRNAIHYLLRDAIDFDPEDAQCRVFHVDHNGPCALEVRGERIIQAAAAVDIAPATGRRGIVSRPVPLT